MTTEMATIQASENSKLWNGSNNAAQILKAGNEWSERKKKKYIELRKEKVYECGKICCDYWKLITNEKRQENWLQTKIQEA